MGLTVKPVGEPDAGNPPVRFDEREVETEHGHNSATLADERASQQGTQTLAIAVHGLTVRIIVTGRRGDRVASGLRGIFGVARPSADLVRIV